MAAEGGAAAPKPKRTRRAAKPKGPACANCGTELVGAYCHGCGQKAHLHDRLSHLFEELIEGIAHFDGRIWKTLPRLAIDPGGLSRDWIAGKRTRYVAPLHLFLFAVFLLFLIPTVTGQRLIDFGEASRIERTEGVDQGGLTFRLDTGEEGQGQPVVAENRMPTEAEIAEAPWLVRAVVKGVSKLTSDPHYYGYKIETLAYKLSFLLVPLSMGVLALLMLFKREVTAYRHGVVSLYGLAFAVLVIILLVLLPSPVSGWLFWPAMIFLMVHAVRHLKDAYPISWPGAVLRGLFLAIMTATVFGLFIAGVVALGVAG
ncbi:DUF3667 domain-containing protein [Brevundimonas sp. 2R-24]|uniref:DUF3667 domain-containing protein n=1 Tax=Peiella sedimenti TaxID=3061083 RepID=A0ABT8SPA6_9CAUL|nr:DUF3667 domain-containing protein [Caulobacteraceae bacterium XZ-24]